MTMATAVAVCRLENYLVLPDNTMDDRIAAILEANGGEVICPRCNRPTMGWPFKRPDKCGGKDSVYCIRDPEAALADIARRAGREAD